MGLGCNESRKEPIRNVNYYSRANYRNCIL
jgi:hypothetical protein